jgi:hypothetical protein
MGDLHVIEARGRIEYIEYDEARLMASVSTRLSQPTTHSQGVGERVIVSCISRSNTISVSHT